MLLGSGRGYSGSHAHHLGRAGRQPSIIHPEDYAAWLDPTSKDAQAILDRARGHVFVTAPVNPAMSNARNKEPEAAAVLEP